MFIICGRPVAHDARGQRPFTSASKPVVHPDENLALGEADRLTKAAGGVNEYVVFKAVAVVKPAEAPTIMERLDLPIAA